MELNIAGGLALKTFTRSLSTLLRLSSSSSAADVDFTCTAGRLSLSVVNPSRTAFGVAHFYQRFFAHYEVMEDERHPGRAFKFAVTGKALLSALRPRSANTVESISISVGPDDPGALLGNDERSERSGDVEGGVFVGGECRVVVKLFCQHGVVKTHRLTYSNANVSNWAKFDKSTCSSSWVASGRVLKDWLDHFHLRGGGGGGGGDKQATDEITFYHSPYECRLKSFNEAAVSGGVEASDPLASRTLSTELIVDVEDFDAYDVNPTQPGPSSGSGGGGSEVVTFGLKEFKAIITLCDSTSSSHSSHSSSTSFSNSSSSSLPLTAHFITGGRPLLFSLTGDQWEARFVVATTDYDSGDGSSGGGGGGSTRDGSVKNESVAAGGSGRRSESAAPPRQAVAGPGPSTSASRSAQAQNDRRPLFNAATPAPASQNQNQSQTAGAGGGGGAANEEEDEDEDEYGGGMDDAFFDNVGDDFFQEVDRLSQVASASQRAPPQSTEARELVRDTSEARPSASGGRGGGGRMELEEEEGFGGEEGGGSNSTQLGPTQYAPREGAEHGEEEYGDETDPGRAAKKPRWNLYGDDCALSIE